MNKTLKRTGTIGGMLILCVWLVSCGGNSGGETKSLPAETVLAEAGTAEDDAADNGTVDNDMEQSGAMENDAAENGTERSWLGEPETGSTVSSDTLQQISKGINDYMSQYKAAGAVYDPPTDSFISTIAVETRRLMDFSAEGGTITRYKDSSEKLLRYRLMLYGETGRTESNYFFADSFIYYTELAEEYCTPITLTSADTDILERTLSEGIMIDDVCYVYDRRNDQIFEHDRIASVFTPKDLDELFTEADAVSDDIAAIDGNGPLKNCKTRP